MPTSWFSNKRWHFSVSFFNRHSRAPARAHQQTTTQTAEKVKPVFLRKWLRRCKTVPQLPTFGSLKQYLTIFQKRGNKTTSRKKPIDKENNWTFNNTSTILTANWFQGAKIWDHLRLKKTSLCVQTMDISPHSAEVGYQTPAIKDECFNRHLHGLVSFFSGLFLTCKYLPDCKCWPQHEERKPVDACIV